VTNWVTEQIKADIWAPVKFEIYLTLASLPLTVISGGAASGAGAGVAKVMGQIALKEALKQATKQALVKWAAKAALQFTIEVVVFSAVNRALVATAAKGYATYTGDKTINPTRFLYDPKKSLVANYAPDIFAGAPIMYFLPRAGAVGDKVAAKMLSRLGSAGKSPLVAEAVFTITDVGSQYATLYTVEKLYKKFDDVALKTPDERLAEAEGKDKSALRTLYLVLGLHSVHSLGSNLVTERPEPLPDAVKDIEITP
jgi:hypothetical protein